MVPATTSLTGFSGETIWPPGQLRLLVIIRDTNHSTQAWMNFMIVRSLSPYNGIIGRPGIRAIQAVPSMVHGMLKFLVEGGIVTIRNTVLIPTECTSVITSSAVSREERTRPANFKVALHPDFPDQEVAIVGTLSDKGRTELCSILKKNLDIFACWRMCVHFTDLNKACSQDCYTLSEINWKVESLCGYPFKCFLDAYKGYHQIQLAETDEEKTAFHTGQGVYCYTKIPFGLKNASATYQRLMDKAFESQVGRNIEVYVDDLVVKSYTEAEMMRDIEETFRTLRKVNMKLNPKKCSFGLAEGMFLGYVVTPEGIKLCPDKIAAVLQLPSPRTLKEVQSLNGKMASLDRFLSKSTEKSLPLFQTLKKCIKKSDFHWTAEAKQAFKQLKQHLSELPLLVAPKPKEELIIYLSANHGAISAVLMTERGAFQMSIYFISRALQGPKLNYSPMEKLVLSLVFAAKRLRRYFQAHPITVVTDQPIKQAKNVGQRTDLSRFSHRDAGRKPTSRASGRNSIGAVDAFHGRLFAASNNEAEYEALIAGLRIAAQMGVKDVHVLVQILKDKSIKEKEVATVIEEDGPTWMTPIVDYVKEGTLPGDKKEARKLRLKAQQYELMEGTLYRRSFLTLWLREVKFLIVAMDYFMKWIEAKAVATITGGQIGMPTYRTVAVDVVSNDEELRLNLDLLEGRRERAAICEANAKLKMTKYYNARVRGVTFKPGDFIYRSNDASHAVAGGKLGPKWEGPYEVTEALGDGAYKLRSRDGTILPGRGTLPTLNDVTSRSQFMHRFQL
nr:reverse transcriptase domain-containing protein [Tanacetum cinerariifolium]